MFTPREREGLMFGRERRDRVDDVAALLSYDLEGPELASYLVRHASLPLRVDEQGQVWVGRRRSEMATRAFQLDPATFTQAAIAAGCAIRWS